MFAARLVAEGSEIKSLRESLDVIAAPQAHLRGGVADLPRPSDEIYSFKPGYQSLPWSITTDFRDSKRGDEEVSLVACTAIHATARFTH
jgi:hypothetical protein